MREGWEYKKLGDVCTIERGGSPRPIADYITESADGINWIKIGDAVEVSKYILFTKEKIRPEGIKKSRFVHKGDVILSNSMSFGKPYILGIDGCIHDGWLVLHDNNNTFSKDYLYYALSSPIMYSKFTQLAVGGVVNNLNSNIVREVVVAIPPLSTQISIVSELDKINELISLKKEQLKDYDNLAQSIFYEMFGDPVVNEKGWELKKLGEEYKVSSSKRIMQDEWTTEGVPFLKVSDVVSKINGQNSEPSTFISETTYSKLVDSNAVPVQNDILITSRGTLGLCYIVKNEDRFYFQDGMITWLAECKGNITPLFLTYLFKNHHFLQQITSKANKSTVAYISISQISKRKIPLPPLALQNLFAQRIELIEQQKAEIQSTIADLETLLASRMQYWFD
ncbi:MAG: restriction endonuclease subunit S [Bacteroides sp.]